MSSFYKAVDSKRAWEVARQIKKVYQDHGLVCFSITEALTGTIYLKVKEADCTPFEVRISDHEALSSFTGISVDINEPETIASLIEDIEWEYSA